jgi:hypothetical protein
MGRQRSEKVKALWLTPEATRDIRNIPITDEESAKRGDGSTDVIELSRGRTCGGMTVGGTRSEQAGGFPLNAPERTIKPSVVNAGGGSESPCQDHVGEESPEKSELVSSVHQ